MILLFCSVLESLMLYSVYWICSCTSIQGNNAGEKIGRYIVKEYSDDLKKPWKLWVDPKKLWDQCGNYMGFCLYVSSMFGFVAVYVLVLRFETHLFKHLVSSCLPKTLSSTLFVLMCIIKYGWSRARDNNHIGKRQKLLSQEFHPCWLLRHALHHSSLCFPHTVPVVVLLETRHLFYALYLPCSVPSLWQALSLPRCWDMGLGF